MEYRSGRQVVSDLHVHLVFVTKSRRGLLDADAHQRLKGAFEKVAAGFGATVVECDGEDDHMHLLLEYPATVPVAKLVNSLKGVGSRLLLRDREDLRRRSPKGLWSPSYFAASCGGPPLDVIRDYVRKQRAPTA
ncbi:IS200/IS605 family transposase [Thioclava sp. DLFJ5-1]|uniref:IS200/IS605 family transposase n=1 Tax=unclassified Thioclava TaxID=2621713 RepID=UPI000997435E|nr:MULTISPECIES: IS200/IS605 family transposase [unclassified Thioclava]OOY04539.1 IS200/IS605 family transposase [Thioclava sp. F28-4]OOY22433.1 IS200/IS605 family transposase [Thioclava sp. DLFJ5-1]